MEAEQAVNGHSAVLAREYLQWLRHLRGRRPATLYNYAATLDHLLRFAGSRSLSHLQLEDLEAFLLRPRTKARGPQAVAGTLGREVSTIRGLYGYLFQRGHVKTNPALFLSAPKRPKREPRPLADDLWLQVWGSELPIDARVVLGLGFFCGLRRMEIVGLRPEQVSKARRQLVAFERKGGGENSLPFGVMLDVFSADMPALFGSEGPDSFLEPLYKLCEDARRWGRPIVLPWAEDVVALVSKRPRVVHELPEGAIDPQWLNKRLRWWLRDIGLARNAFTPHALRYSCATNLARCGMPVQIIQRLLNHASISTTQRYVRTTNVEVEAWLEGRLALRRESSRHT